MPDRSKPAQRADFADFYRLQTRWMDNDVYGHMNNAVHYTLFDTAINGWLVDRGLLDVQKSDSYGLVVETGCRYHAELAFPSWITAGLRVSKLGNSSVRYEIGLFTERSEHAAAEGFFVHVYVDRANHRPTRIDDARRAALATLQRD